MKISLFDRVENTVGKGQGFFMGRGRYPGPPSWGKIHQYRGKFIVGYLASLLLIFKHNKVYIRGTLFKFVEKGSLFKTA